MKPFFKSLHNVLGQVISLTIFILALGCAPTFSEMQSARTVGKNNIEITPTISAVESSQASGNVQNHYGLQAAYGLSEKLDLRVRYERIVYDDENGQNIGTNILGFGPKYSFIKNKVTGYLPLGRALGNNSENTWQLQPTLLLTQAIIDNKLNATLSPKYLLRLCSMCDDLVAFNIGFSISSDLNKWSVRPEYGMLFNPGSEGHFRQFSVGLSKTL